MKWVALLACFVFIVWVMWALEMDDSSSLRGRVNALECLSGQNCARIDTLEAWVPREGE